MELYSINWKRKTNRIDSIDHVLHCVKNRLVRFATREQIYNTKNTDDINFNINF